MLCKQLSWRRKSLDLDQKVWLYPVLALRTQTQDNFSFLKTIYLFGCIESQLRHTGSLLYHAWPFVAAHRLSSCGTRAPLLCSTWDLSSLTRDRTCVPCIARCILNHSTTRERSPNDNFSEFSFPHSKNNALQPRCSSAGKWINKLLYTHTMEYYSVMKINKLLGFKKTWRNLSCTFLSESSQSEKAMYSVIPTKWHSGKGKTIEIA